MSHKPEHEAGATEFLRIEPERRTPRVFLRTPFNYNMNTAGDESGLHCTDKTRTQQHFAEEVDINTIVRRFNLTGELPKDIRMPVFQDFTDIYDFHSAMNAVTQAREAFDKMPASVRTRFHNDAAEFVQFCTNDENLGEARKMGLVPPEELPEPTEQPTPPRPPGSGPGTQGRVLRVTPKGVTQPSYIK